MTDHEIMCNKLEKEIPDIAFDFLNESETISYAAMKFFSNDLAITIVAALLYRYSAITHN